MPAVIENTYSFTAEGDKPLPVLKKTMEELRSVGNNHPVLNAKGFELVAIPEKTNVDRFVNEFTASTAEPNKVYIAILKLGASKTETTEKLEMTGKCNVKENIVKGARKWETKYVVYTPQGIKDADGVAVRDENGIAISRNIELASFDTKTEAMVAAKQYAVEQDKVVLVELEKRLSGSKSNVAELSPQKKMVKETKETSVNQFLYFGRGE